MLGKRKADYPAGIRMSEPGEKCVFGYANIFNRNIQSFFNFCGIKYYGKRIIITIIMLLAEGN